MAQLRLALAQVNPIVGNLEGNSSMIVTMSRHAAGRGAHVVVFPEMVLTGYPVEDLALRASFIEASKRTLDDLAVRLAAEGLGEIAVVVGYLDGSPAAEPVVGRPAGAPENAAAWIYGGRVVARTAKHHLPNYGVFDEFRYFVPGNRLSVTRLHGVDVALTICEDIWQDGGPVAVARIARAGLLLVSATPRSRSETRR